VHLQLLCCAQACAQQLLRCRAGTYKLVRPRAAVLRQIVSRTVQACTSSVFRSCRCCGSQACEPQLVVFGLLLLRRLHKLVSLQQQRGHLQAARNTTFTLLGCLSAAWRTSQACEAPASCRKAAANTQNKTKGALTCLPFCFVLLLLRCSFVVGSLCVANSHCTSLYCVISFATQKKFLLCS
jgi:hypothetical protein